MNIDLDALAQEFDIEVNDALMDQPIIEIETLTSNTVSNPDEVIATNINKANAILDRVITEINNVGMTPRLGEVASQLIANINQAAGQIYTKEIDIFGLRLKKKMVELKEREVMIKEKMLSLTSKQGSTVNNNLIISDRETILKLLKENKTKLLENNVGENGDYDGNE